MQTEAQSQTAIVALNGKHFFGTNLVVNWAEFAPGKGLNLSRMLELMKVPAPIHTTPSGGVQ
jgi:hypothetical protein